MRKKLFLLLANIILLLGLAGYFWYSSGQTEAISCPVAGEKKLESVRATMELTKDNILTDLRFNQVSLVQDVASGTFYLPLDMEQEQWEDGELTSGQSEVTLLFAEDFSRVDKQTAIAQGKAYEFLAVKGNTYRSYYLVFTGLPIISIETEETPDTEVFGGTVRFWEADSKRDWSYSNILEANIRGNTSRIYPKKGYKLTLKKQDSNGNVVEDKRSLFGLREDDEYILNAMYTDSSKIRDALCAHIWGSMGASVEGYQDMYLGTRMTYVEVFFNGEYRGLYALMEPVDSKQLDLTKEQEKGTVEYSYKSSTPQSIATDVWERMEAWTAEMAGFELKGSHSQITKESWQPLFDYLNWRDSQEEEAFIEDAGNLIDPDNMMRMWVYLQAVMGLDNRGKNMYYVAKYEEDGYRMYLAPWDMDLTLGDTLQNPTDEYPWDVGPNPMVYRERINFEPGDRMIELDAAGARSRVYEIWEESRQGVLSSENLQTRIDELSRQVMDSGAMARDEQRWPEGKHDTDYEKFKILTCYRMEYLDEFFYDDLEEYLNLGYS